MKKCLRPHNHFFAPEQNICRLYTLITQDHFFAREQNICRLYTLITQANPQRISHQTARSRRKERPHPCM
jgi:hypothetical protein